jgi:acyl carrier protein
LTREEILQVVKKNLSDAVDGVDADAVDTSRSMKDLGANSLDMVEVVSRTMRELKIKVPRSELAKLTNINGLVDVLYEAQFTKAETPGNPS